MTLFASTILLRDTLINVWNTTYEAAVWTDGRWVSDCTALDAAITAYRAAWSADYAACVGVAPSDSDWSATMATTTVGCAIDGLASLGAA